MPARDGAEKALRNQPCLPGAAASRYGLEVTRLRTKWTAG
jgi:hypothetical protein